MNGQFKFSVLNASFSAPGTFFLGFSFSGKNVLKEKFRTEVCKLKTTQPIFVKDVFELQLKDTTLTTLAVTVFAISPSSGSSKPEISAVGRTFTSLDSFQAHSFAERASQPQLPSTIFEFSETKTLTFTAAENMPMSLIKAKSVEAGLAMTARAGGRRELVGNPEEEESPPQPLPASNKNANGESFQGTVELRLTLFLDPDPVQPANPAVSIVTDRSPLTADVIFLSAQNLSTVAPSHPPTPTPSHGTSL